MNNNVIYIDYLDSYYDITKKNFPKWIKKFIYKMMNCFGIVLNKENEISLTAVENDKVNKRMLKKLYKIMENSKLKHVVCADRLLENQEFISRLKKRNFNVLNGSWLNKYLASLIIKKVAYIENFSISSMEISVLVKENSDCCEQFILEMAKECKLLNIITEDIKAFSFIEKELENEGILINVSTNKDKSLRHSNIIVNYDFSKKELLECKFSGILVQLNKERFERRSGITIRDCRLKLPYLEKFNYISGINHFTDEILYESIIFHKITYDNIQKIFKRDNIQIKYFVGNNGKIEFSEFQKEQRKFIKKMQKKT